MLSVVGKTATLITMEELMGVCNLSGTIPGAFQLKLLLPSTSLGIGSTIRSILPVRKPKQRKMK